jgi:hypothetical protein
VSSSSEEPADLGRWSPVSPQEAAAALSGFRRPWWIAGGVAIELFVGRRIRDHGDLDVEVLRIDQAELHGALSDWDLRIASRGRLTRWLEGAAVPGEANDIWCRDDPEGPWRFEIVLAASDGHRWLYRRDQTVWRPLTEVGSGTSDGFPYLRPELVLLFKAKDTRPKDEQDLEAAVPLMDEGARAWLRHALETAHPGHPWIGRL